MGWQKGSSKGWSTRGCSTFRLTDAYLRCKHPALIVDVRLSSFPTPGPLQGLGRGSQDTAEKLLFVGTPSQRLGSRVRQNQAVSQTPSRSSFYLNTTLSASPPGGKEGLNEVRIDWSLRDGRSIWDFRRVLLVHFLEARQSAEPQARLLVGGRAFVLAFLVSASIQWVLCGAFFPLNWYIE